MLSARYGRPQQRTPHAAAPPAADEPQPRSVANARAGVGGAAAPRAETKKPEIDVPYIVANRPSVKVVRRFMAVQAQGISAACAADDEFL
jgi:hypothetical protein